MARKKKTTPTPPVKKEHKKTFRLTPEEVDALELIKEYHRLNTENAAVKKAITFYLIEVGHRRKLQDENQKLIREKEEISEHIRNYSKYKNIIENY